MDPDEPQPTPPPHPRQLCGDGVAYLCEQTHSSIPRGLVALGFPPDHRRVLESDASFRLSTSSVAEAVADDRRAGRRPAFVIATAGSTNCGAVDDLVDTTSVTADEIDFRDRTLELTRHARALKLWLSFRTYGVARFRAAIARGIELRLCTTNPRASESEIAATLERLGAPSGQGPSLDADHSSL